jgi:hypothetical protein
VSHRYTQRVCALAKWCARCCCLCCCTGALSLARRQTPPATLDGLPVPLMVLFCCWSVPMNAHTRLRTLIQFGYLFVTVLWVVPGSFVSCRWFVGGSVRVGCLELSRHNCWYYVCVLCTDFAAADVCVSRSFRDVPVHVPTTNNK